MTSPKAPLVVTTSGKLRKKHEVDEARRIAARLGVAYVERSANAPVSAFLDQAEAVLVMRGDGVVLLDTQGDFRWSPGMAHVRVNRLDEGVQQPDGILVVGEAREGDEMLDCTLGLGQDALVLARAVGPRGRVVGVEASLPLFAAVSVGLERHDYGPRSCHVEVVHASALDYLRTQKDASFDCVYFDPMFGRPGRSQPAFEVLRRHADHSPLTPTLLEEAQRVARRWVVVKAAPYSMDLRTLGLKQEPWRRNADLRFARLPGRQTLTANE